MLGGWAIGAGATGSGAIITGWLLGGAVGSEGWTGANCSVGIPKLVLGAAGGLGSGGKFG